MADQLGSAESGDEHSSAAKTRRIDLLGLRRDGSLVVFECKVAANKDSPLVALLEGLDYLGCLLTHKNIEKLNDGFLKWRRGRATAALGPSQVPPGFQDVQIERTGKPHGVVVLAPAAYFQKHECDANGIRQDRDYLSDRFWGGKPTGSPSIQPPARPASSSTSQLPISPLLNASG